MQRSNLLVVTKEMTEDLKATVTELGVGTVIYPELKEALLNLQRETFLSMLLDIRHLRNNDDVLEMVVNIRDANSSIPILIYGNASEKTKRQLMLCTHYNFGPIYLIEENGSIRKFGQTAKKSNSIKGSSK